MNITELDDRQIEILQLIIEHIDKDEKSPQFHGVQLYHVLQNEREDLKNRREMENLLEFLRLFGIGDYSHRDGFQILNRIPLKNLLKDGGIRGAIERAKSFEENLSSRQEKFNELIELKTKKLSKELDEKTTAIEKELKQTTIDKNKEQMKLIKDQQLIIWITLGVSILALIKAFGLI